MELQQLFLVLRCWYWLIGLGLVIGCLLGYGISRVSQPVYQASTTLLVNQAPGNQPSDYTSILTSERLARTYAELMVKAPVLEEVVARNHLDIKPGMVGSRVSVELVRDTQLIVLSVEDTDAGRAALLANAIPEVFIKQNQALQDDRYAASKVSLSAESDSLNEQISQVQERISEIGEPADARQQAELDRLQTQLASYRQSYTGILQTYEAIRLAEAQSTSTVIVAEPARTPDVPIRPRTLLNTALAGIAGLALAVSSVILKENLDDTLKSPEQVRSWLSVPVLGVLGKLSASDLKAGPFAMVAPRSPATEAYRVLRTNIQFSSLDKPLRKLLVASSGPSEGKSTVAANLVVVMAQAGNRVILLDGDLRRPSLHRVFNVPNSTGLSHLAISPGTKLDGALVSTSVPGLSLIPTGPLPPNPAELLGSAKMTSLLDEMVRQADVVIIDSPPVSAVADAAILSGKVDGVVMVIYAAATRMAPALHAKEQFERAGAVVLGVAINRVSPDLGGYYYYYNYHYYGQGKKSRSNGNGRGPLGLFGGRKRAADGPTPPVREIDMRPPMEQPDPDQD